MKGKLMAKWSNDFSISWTLGLSMSQCGLDHVFLQHCQQNSGVNLGSGCWNCMRLLLWQCSAFSQAHKHSWVDGKNGSFLFPGTSSAVSLSAGKPVRNTKSKTLGSDWCSLWLMLLLVLFVEHHLVLTSKIILRSLVICKQDTQNAEY